MDTLTGTDKFHQLLKKFNNLQPSTNAQSNHETSVRKSNREVRKPIMFDASPHVTAAKQVRKQVAASREVRKPIKFDARPRVAAAAQQPKRKGKTVEPRNMSAERRNRSGECGDGSGRRQDKSRERLTDTDPEAPVVSRADEQDSGEEFVSSGPSTQRSAFTRVSSSDHRSTTLSRHMPQEPVVQSQTYRRTDRLHREDPPQRQPNDERSHITDHRRLRSLDSSHMPERRQEYDAGYVPDRRLRDNRQHGDRTCDIFTKPYPVLPEQPPNAFQNYDGCIRQPVMRVQEHSFLHRSRIDVPADIRQPVVRLYDIMKSRERDMWQNSRVAQPDHPKRFDGGFLRPPTPPGAAKLAKEEQSTFLDTVSNFTNCELFSTAEVVFLLNRLEDSLIHKISKTIRKSESAQSSMLKMTKMETGPEDTTKTHMVQSWLRSNDSVHPQRLLSNAEARSKRMREPTEYEYAKRMRVAAAEDEFSNQHSREPRHHNQSRSLMNRMDDRRRLDISTPISHLDC